MSARDGGASSDAKATKASTKASTSATTDETLEEIEADLDRARVRVATSLQTLGEEMNRRGDWREWVRTHPALFLAGAAALGFFWGRSGGRSRLT
jgi:hypothetical protein